MLKAAQWFLVLVLFSTLSGALAAPVQAAPNPDEDNPSVGLQLVVDGLTSPVYMTAAPDGSGRTFIVDQVGLIWILNPDGQLNDTPFLDIRDRLITLNPRYDERGLLGLAFHPDYANNGRFFVYYSAPLREGAPAGFDHTNVLSEFSVSAEDPDLADPASERILLQDDHPQFNHNGGTVAFGPDGYLYLSIGDGGGANDVGLGHVEDWYDGNAGGNGQDITQNLEGNLLRLDVDSGDPYGIPADNPFVGKEGLDEIFAYGFRNPYRFSFDQGGNHAIYLGDAGQNLWEEADLVVKGGNYGWNVREGAHCFDAENPHEVIPSTECPSAMPDGTPLLDPIIEYPNAHNPLGGGIGHVIVGGYIYRGSKLPQFSGRYIFGDWSSSDEMPAGVLMVAQPRKTGLWNILTLNVTTSPNGELNHFILAFGQDPSGEVYVLTTDNFGPSGTTGKIFKLIKPSGK